MSWCIVAATLKAPIVHPSIFFQLPSLPNLSVAKGWFTVSFVCNKLPGLMLVKLFQAGAFPQKF
jgi:hypothetical protein